MSDLLSDEWVRNWHAQVAASQARLLDQQIIDTAIYGTGYLQTNTEELDMEERVNTEASATLEPAETARIILPDAVAPDGRGLRRRPGYVAEPLDTRPQPEPGSTYRTMGFDFTVHDVRRNDDHDIFILSKEIRGTQRCFVHVTGGAYGTTCYGGCEERHHTLSDDSIQSCPTCYEERTITCATCSDQFNVEDIRHCDNHGHDVCDGCWIIEDDDPENFNSAGGRPVFNADGGRTTSYHSRPSYGHAPMSQPSEQPIETPPELTDVTPDHEAIFENIYEKDGEKAVIQAMKNFRYVQAAIDPFIERLKNPTTGGELMGKAYADYTIGDVKRLKGSFLIKDKGKEAIQSQLESVDYILQMGSTMGVPISKYKVLEHFQCPDEKNSVVTDKSVINKLIVGIKEQRLSELDNADWKLKYVEDKIIKMTQQRYIGDIKSIGNAIESRMTDINYYQKEMDKFFKEVISKRVQKEAMEKALAENKGGLDEVQRILKDPFWTFLGTGPNILYFLTDEIALTHKNPAAGVDLTVDMGRYCIELDFFKNSIRVGAGVNTIIYDGYTHPHISSGRGFSIPCWGNGKESYLQSMAEGDWKTALDIIKAVLTLYNSGSPYKRLDQYAKIQSNADKRVNMDTFLMKKYELTEDQYKDKPKPEQRKRGDFRQNDRVRVGSKTGSIKYVAAIDKEDYYVGYHIRDWVTGEGLRLEKGDPRAHVYKVTAEKIKAEQGRGGGGSYGGYNLLLLDQEEELI